MPWLRVLPADQAAQCEPGSLHEACVEQSLPVPFGCTVGKCGVCRVRVVEGKLAPASAFERAVLEGFGCEPDVRLACQAKWSEDVTIETLGARRQPGTSS